MKGPHVASRDSRELKKQSLHKAKGPLVEEQYAREALVAKSQLRVKENKISPRAPGLGPHCMRKCPPKVKKCPRPLGKGPSVSLVGRKVRTYWSKIIVVPGSSRMKTVSSREEEINTLQVKWLSRKKRVSWQRMACHIKHLSAHSKNSSAEVPTMNQIGLHAS